MKEGKQRQLERILPVLDYVQQHYNRSILPKELEAISYYSYRSLQRIFKALFKENIGAYQKRLRLENAVKLLSYSNKPITDIALEVGYSDLQAFRKAFKNTYGVAPSVQRPILMNLLEELKLTMPNQVFVVEGLEARIVDLPSIKVWSKTYRGAYTNQALEQLWVDVAEQCNNFDELEQYGLVYDDPYITEESLCRYDACVSQNNTLEGVLVSRNIGAGRYAQFLHKGTYDQIEQTYDAIFGGWLLEVEYDFASAPIIEHYHSTGERTIIYIPIA